jgi:hypothetical protein
MREVYALSRFYVCKHCKRKIHISELSKHTMNNHIDHNYWIVEYDSQTVFEIQNNELSGKVEIKDTKEEMDKKYGFRFEDNKTKD